MAYILTYALSFFDTIHDPRVLPTLLCSSRTLFTGLTPCAVRLPTEEKAVRVLCQGPTFCFAPEIGLVPPKDCRSVDLSPLRNVRRIGNGFLEGRFYLESLGEDFQAIVSNVETVGENFCGSCFSLQSIDLSGFRRV